MTNSANQQKPKWQNSSPRGGNYDWINDETLYGTLNTHDVLWRRVLDRFPDAPNTTVVVIGYGSVPIGIELSQRLYRVDYLAQSQAEAQKVRRDCEAQAGNFQHIFIMDYRTDVPKGTVAIFTGLMGSIQKERHTRYWLDLLLRRVHIILCAERTTKRNWKRFLEGKYHINGLVYNKNQYTLMEIERGGA